MAKDTEPLRRTTEQELVLKIPLVEVRGRLAQEAQLFVEVFRSGACSVELYAPRGEDLQGPHERDELYVISRGHGRFRRGGAVVAFEAGDVLFVPTGVLHRFEKFSEDFETWVIFFGPEGGGGVE